MHIVDDSRQPTDLSVTCQALELSKDLFILHMQMAAACSAERVVNGAMKATNLVDCSSCNESREATSGLVGWSKQQSQASLGANITVSGGIQRLAAAIHGQHAWPPPPTAHM